jgi:hypothetical protein
VENRLPLDLGLAAVSALEALMVVLDEALLLTDL